MPRQTPDSGGFDEDNSQFYITEPSFTKINPRFESAIKVAAQLTEADIKIIEANPLEKDITDSKKIYHLREIEERDLQSLLDETRVQGLINKLIYCNTILKLPNPQLFIGDIYSKPSEYTENFLFENELAEPRRLEEEYFNEENEKQQSMHALLMRLETIGDTYIYVLMGTWHHHESENIKLTQAEYLNIALFDYRISTSPGEEIEGTTYVYLHEKTYQIRAFNERDFTSLSDTRRHEQIEKIRMGIQVLTAISPLVGYQATQEIFIGDGFFTPEEVRELIELDGKDNEQYYYIPSSQGLFIKIIPQDSQKGDKDIYARVDFWLYEPLNIAIENIRRSLKDKDFTVKSKHLEDNGIVIDNIGYTLRELEEGELTEIMNSTEKELIEKRLMYCRESLGIDELQLCIGDVIPFNQTIIIWGEEEAVEINKVYENSNQAKLPHSQGLFVEIPHPDDKNFAIYILIAKWPVLSF